MRAPLPVPPHAAWCRVCRVPCRVQGASTTFQPLSGMLRGNCGNTPLAGSAVLAAARVHDKATVALYRRPAARLLFTAYVLLLHVLVLL